MARCFWWLHPIRGLVIVACFVAAGTFLVILDRCSAGSLPNFIFSGALAVFLASLGSRVRR